MHVQLAKMTQIVAAMQVSGTIVGLRRTLLAVQGGAAKLLQHTHAKDVTLMLIAVTQQGILPVGMSKTLTASQDGAIMLL